MIDSELVPWGKGEKQAGEAVEKESETICLQGTEALTSAQHWNFQVLIFNFHWIYNELIFKRLEIASLLAWLKIVNWKLEIPLLCSGG